MPYTIDPHSPLPRYFQVYDSLRGRIAAGEFLQQSLPAERRLVDEYGVSRITVVKALDRLQAEGWIERRHGSGTFVKQYKSSIRIDSDCPLQTSLQQQGIDAEWQLLDREWMSTPEPIRHAHQLPTQQQQYRISLLVNSARGPLALQRVHVSHALAMREQLDQCKAQQLIDFVVDTAQQPQQQLQAAIASDDIASLLAVKAGSPLLILDLLYHNKEQQVDRFTRCYFRGDQCYFCN